MTDQEEFVKDELARFSRFIPVDKSWEGAKLPLKYFPDAITAVLPSIEMGRDGPSLRRFFLISERYFCGVEFGPLGHDLDFRSKFTVVGYSLRLSDIPTSHGSRSTIFRVADARLFHSFGANPSQTALSFVGEIGRDEWVNAFFDAFPMAVMDPQQGKVLAHASNGG